MSYVRGEDRGQVALLPAAIEDYAAAAGSGDRRICGRSRREGARVWAVGAGSDRAASLRATSAGLAPDPQDDARDAQLFVKSEH
jgi:hypothetical protein